MSIQVLPLEVVNQIAAGEVVERPAHLLKELIENSLDARATHIEVDIDHGGRTLRVIDDGCGIEPQDMTQLFSRHATSKIVSGEDLWRLQTYGFRGEALASIGAVCRLSMISRPSSQSTAMRIQNAFSQISALEGQSHAVGTTVIIEDLFANVPARRKFLKTDSAEIGQIKQVLKALAMAHPEVEFRVRQAGDLLFYWPKQEKFNLRCQQVLDYQPLFSGELIDVDYQARVAVGSPQQPLQQNRGVWLLIQGRWVQDRALSVAVYEAYRHLLMHGEYPVAVVDVRLPADLVDVNIHPTKSQVKFAEPQRVFRLVTQAVRQVLMSAPWLGGNQPAAQSASQPASQSTSSTLPRLQSHQTEYTLDAQQLTLADEASASAAADLSRIQYARRESTSVSLTLPIHPPERVTSSHLETQSVQPTGFRWGSLQVLAQAQLTYIVAQSDKSLFLIDQHAAHERVMFERLMQGWRNRGLEVQTYLMPLVVDLTVAQVESVMKQKSELNQMGFDVDSLGPEALAIAAAPALVSDHGIRHAISRLGQELEEQGGSFAWEKQLGEIFASMACHSVVRAGQSLTREEMSDILMQMDEFPLSSFCPHGRPVFIEHSFREIEKSFGRIL